MTDVERRTCPLLWCREVFPSEEVMLKHVYTCEYLSKGLYWCFHCQKPERVGKFQCKRCQGNPSTADRLTTAARNFFSGLGVMKSATSQAPTGYPNVASRRDSKCSASPSKAECAQLQDIEMDHEDCQQSELPNSTISEMEAENVFELSADWAMSSQELPDSALVEMTGSEFGPISSSNYPNEKTSHYPWDLQVDNVTPDSLYATNPRRPSQPIPLRLDTCVAELQRQHPSRSDMSTILSPLSPSDRIGSGIFTVSPTDTVVSSKSMFSSSDCSSATTISSWDESSNSLGWEKDVNCSDRTLAASLGRFPSNASEKLLRDGPSSPSMPQIMPATLSDTIHRYPSNSSNSSSASHSAKRCTMSKERPTISAQWSCPKDLVKALLEVLEEHTEHSRQALIKIPPNSNTAELLALSTHSIRSIGFEVLERLLEGRKPSSLVHIFAFTNVAYSMAVAADRDSSKVRSEQWFEHCLSWSTLLPSERDKRRYEQIACAIWQPQTTSHAASNSSIIDDMRRDNTLFAACKHFLDRKYHFLVTLKEAAYKITSSPNPWLPRKSHIYN